MTSHDAPVIDLEDGDAIAAYGRELIRDALASEATALLVTSPSRPLVATMADIAQALRAADARSIRRSVGLFGRLLGADLEQEARARQLKERLGVLLASADQQAADLKRFIAGLDELQTQFRAAAQRLTLLVEDGRQQLAETPDTGPAATAGEATVGAAPRQRFERRLAHLATVATSYTMTGQQLRLTQVQSIALLDSYGRIRDVLLPVWRQYVLALSNQQLLDPSLTDGAARAHDLVQAEVSRLAAD